jgi:hypothetical protein|tara:strand:+ start:4294 stop:6009 length:1716 start_codon:yes stop_codon:yes gene_type:complete
MPIVTTDWTITRTNGNVRYIGDDHIGASPSYATVIEFHRFLQDLADDAVSLGDDELDITDEDPSSRSTDNIITLLGNYNIDNTAAEHLFDGSIIQNGGADIYDGVVNFGNIDVQIQIIQNGAVLADDWWNFGGGGLNASALQGISHRFMIKTRTAGTDIDGRRVIGITRQFGKTFAEFPINGTARGNNVLALSNSDDLNNQTTGTTVSAFTITNTTQGYIGIDVNNDGTPEFYYSQWNINTPTNSINDFYEYAKYITRDGSVDTIYGISGELFRGITHQISLSANTGTFNAFEAVSWPTGTGQMLAIDSPTAGTAMWIQLLTGNSPTSGQLITGGVSSATSNVGASIISRSVSSPFIGQSTGSAIIGAYGLGIETGDLTNSDTLFSLANVSVTPPNNVNFSVGGLVIGEDRVLVAPWDGSTLDAEGNPAIDQPQLSLSVTLSADNITTVTVTTAIPSDTPNVGTIRVVDNDGFDRRLSYSSYTGSIFAITTTDGQEDFTTVNATSGNDVYITYIDTLAAGTTETFTAVYNVDRDLVIIVRDGGVTPIRQFITSGTFSSSDTTVTAIRTSDL